MGTACYGNLNSDSPVCLSTDYTFIDRSASNLGLSVHIQGFLPTIMSLSSALIFITAWTHVLLAPYTKVEESFNLHATHDVLMYGVGIDKLYNVRVCPYE